MSHRIELMDNNNFSQNIKILNFRFPKNLYICGLKMVVVAQSVRASDCGSEGRGFESRLPPKKSRAIA